MLLCDLDLTLEAPKLYRLAGNLVDQRHEFITASLLCRCQVSVCRFNRATDATPHVDLPCRIKAGLERVFRTGIARGMGYKRGVFTETSPRSS
jgi:hypothetical protein